MDLADVMDEVAGRLGTINSLRAYAYPAAKIVAPTEGAVAIVTYPTEYTYDETYGRGVDRMNLPLLILVPRPTDRTARDRIAKYCNGSGAESVKAALDDDGYVSCDSVRVQGVDIDSVTVAGTEYLAATFSLDIFGRGTA